MAKSWSVNIPNPVSNVTVRWPHEKLSPALFQWKVENSHQISTFSLSFLILWCVRTLLTSQLLQYQVLETEWQQDTTSCVLINWKLDLKIHPCQNHAQVFFYLFWSFQNVFQMSFLTWLWPWMLTAALQCWMYVCVRKKWNGYKVHSPPSCPFQFHIGCIFAKVM